MKLKYVIPTSIILIVLYFIINSSIGILQFTSIKNLITFDQRLLFKKFFFPKKYNEQYKHEIKEFKFKESLKPFQTSKKKIKKLNNFISPAIKTLFFYDMKLEKYRIKDGFYSGINKENPGSGYIDFYDDNLIIVSSKGVIARSTYLDDSFKFEQIDNNVDDFINLKQFVKNRSFSIKDLLISENLIFLSYTEEIEKNCWNTSIIFAKFNYDYLNFKKLFTPPKCVHSIDNIDGEFNPHQSGGRIIKYNDDEILLTTGDYRSRYLSQDIKSINGKILKINIKDSSYNILSMGHRNPQGLLFDRENQKIISTEHGPAGGDEINIIKIDTEKVPNYGWPIASYGEHYGNKKKNEYKYLKYPLLKSHIDHNFIEPIKYFVPSIGISEIIKANDGLYITSSLKHLSIYTFKLDKNNNILNFEKIVVGERVRDLVFKNNKLYLFLENSASLGIINF